MFLPTKSLPWLAALLLLAQIPGAHARPPAGATDAARQALAQALASPAAMAPPSSPVRRLVRAEALVMAHTRLRALPIFLAAMEMAPRGECGAAARLLRAAVRVRPLEAAGLGEVAVETNPGCSQVLQVALLLPSRAGSPGGDSLPALSLVAATTTFKEGPADRDAKSVAVITEPTASDAAALDDLHGLDLGEPEADSAGTFLATGLGVGPGQSGLGLLSLLPTGPAVTSVVNQ